MATRKPSPRVTSVLRAARLKAGTPTKDPKSGKVTVHKGGPPKTSSGAFGPANRAAGAAVGRAKLKIKDVVNKLKRTPPKGSGTFQEHGRQRREYKKNN